MKNFDWKQLAVNGLLIVLSLLGYNELTAVEQPPESEPVVMTLADIEKAAFAPQIEQRFVVTGDVMLTDVDTLSAPGRPDYLYVNGHVYYIDGQEIILKGKKKYSKADILSQLKISPFLLKYYCCIGEIDPDVKIVQTKPLPPDEPNDQPDPKTR